MRRLSSSIMDSYIIRYFHPHTQPNSQSYYTGFVKPLVHLPNGLISYTIKNLNLCNIFKHFSLTKGVTHLSSISFFVYFIIPNSLAYQYLNKKNELQATLWLRFILVNFHIIPYIKTQ